MRSFTLRTSWKKPETLRILMARRRWIERLAGIGLVVRGGLKVAVRDVETGADVVGGMGAIGIVDRVRRCRLVRMRRWKRLGVLRRAAMLRWMTRCWMRRRVLVGMRKRLVRVRRERMDSAGGVGVADGGGDAGLRAKARVRRRLGMRRMSSM